MEGNAGWVRVRLTGLHLERHLSNMAEKGIVLRKVQRISYAQMQLEVRASQYQKLKKALPARGVHMKRTAASPAVTAGLSLRRRYALWCALFVFSAALIFASGRVWQVSVSGNELLESEILLEGVRHAGYAPGQNWTPARIQELEESLKKDLPILDFVAVTRRGAELLVQVKERKETLISDDSPADIIAMKDCQIESLTVLAGRGITLEGQPVKKGDVLISGQLVYSEQNFKYIHALGNATGIVWYTGKADLVLQKKITERTGKRYVRRAVSLFGQEILLGQPVSFAGYEEERGGIQPGILPMFEITYYETEEVSVAISEEMALKEAHIQLTQQLLQEIPLSAEVLEEKLTSYNENGHLWAELYMKTREEVGKTSQLLKNG